MNMITAFLISTAALAVPQPATVTLDYQDLARLSEHVEAVCPIMRDGSKTDGERGRLITKFAREHGYQGARFILLDLICSQWGKGYIEGARKGPVK